MTGIAYAELIKKASNKNSSTHRWFLHDNAPVHTAGVTLDALKNSCFKPIHHPPYSPDLAPSDYYLFRHLKKFLRGTWFGSTEELKMTVTQWLNGRDSQFWRAAFDELPVRWRKCVTNGGDYIEKNWKSCIFYLQCLLILHSKFHWCEIDISLLFALI